MYASMKRRSDIKHSGELCSLSLPDMPGAFSLAELLAGRLAPILPYRAVGTVRRCTGQLVTAAGLRGVVGLGDVCHIARGAGGSPSGDLLAEVVGFEEGEVRLLAYDDPIGLSAGNRIVHERNHQLVRPHESWRGRVLDAMGEPVDGAGPLASGARAYALRARPIPAQSRRLMGERLHLGARALDLFVPCCRGQRLGIFAGSGVGKSSLLSMIARNSDADVMVIGLVGERGRELNEFLEHTLGPEGRARSVVVVATSDAPPMMRRRAAYLTLTIAEYFRDRGAQVLCLLDSVTRFAMALREIYLAAGELPASRGYPPSVFAELPRLLERAGPGAGRGTITGLFTVLVEGDDLNEPVTDTVRSVLDGHIVLDRRIAERGRFPAVDVLKSISRAAPACYAPQEAALIGRARRLLAVYSDMAELIELGAYRPGSNAAVDEAIAGQEAIERVLRQEIDEDTRSEDPFAVLAAALGVEMATVSPADA